MSIKGKLYRLIMTLAHKYHWHYAPPIYPEGDTQLWCKWCGFRQTVSQRRKSSTAIIEDAQKIMRSYGDIPVIDLARKLLEEQGFPMPAEEEE